MRFDRFRRFSVALCVLAGACSNPTALAEAERAKRVPELPRSEDPLDQELARRAASEALGMVVHDNAFRTTLDKNGEQDFLVVLTGGHCYKAIGVGDTQVNDLDLSLIDPSGVLVQQDTSRDSHATLGEDAPLCLQDAGAYRLHVRMREGSGTFLVRFFKTEQ